MDLLRQVNKRRLQQLISVS